MKIQKVSVTISAVLFICGCSSWPQPPTLSVGRADNMVIDGVHNEKCWSHTPEYSLTTARSRMNELHPDLREKYGRKPAGPGLIRLLADQKNLYIGAVLHDDDIICLGTRDQQLHSGEGDVFEIFLKPENADYYWEIHITPCRLLRGAFLPVARIPFAPQNRIAGNPSVKENQIQIRYYGNP